MIDCVADYLTASALRRVLMFTRIFYYGIVKKRHIGILEWAMKIKVIKNKKTLETRVEYFRVDDKSAFRFNLLKNILNDIDSQVTLIIDTNQVIKKISKEDIEEILSSAGVAFTVFSIKPKPKEIASIRIKDKKKNKRENEWLYLLEISYERFSRELFEDFLQYCDLGFCIKAKKALEEVCDIIRMDSFDELMFDEEYFENYIYDSIVCETIRSSVDIQNYL